jgi:DNA-binding NarL/FixJ family response regulator
MTVQTDVQDADGSHRTGSAVVLWVRNPIERMGLLGLAHTAGHDVTAFGPATGTDSLGAAVAAAARGDGAVLVVALRDVGPGERTLLERSAAAGTRLLVIVDDPADVARVAAVRCSGFLLSDGLDAERFGRALARVLAGEVPIPPQVAHHLLAAVPVSESTPVRLTPREQQTLILLVDGLSNKQIAKRLGVSGHGAKRLVANVLAKLDCTNRTAAVARALREGVYEHCVRSAARTAGVPSER